MTERTKVEVNLLLTAGDSCQQCQERLLQRVQSYRGIEEAHFDLEGDAPRFCIHYDPNLISLDYIRALAVEEGALLEWRYRHETLPIAGLDCADCAQTLESSVDRLDGVRWVSVNFAASTLTVAYDAEQVDQAEIVARIQSLGYDVIEPARADRAAPSPEMVFDVEGLDCADCAVHLEEALRNTAGVAQVSVDFSLARLRLKPQDGMEIQSSVERVAREMGYSLRAEAAPAVEEEPRPWYERLWRRRRDLTTAVAGLLIAVAVLMQWLDLPERAVAATFIAAIAVGGYYIARSGWVALRTARTLDMNALMSIAALGAIFVGEWAEGAVAMFLFSLGNTLEGYTMDRARNAIRSLMVLSPRRATVLHGTRE